MVKFFRAANKVVRPLLASRFHKPLSERLMLLTYKGHRTGREFTDPIGYFDWDPGTVLAMSSQLGWIPSMRQGSAVRLRIRGQDHGAVPTVVEDPEKVAALLGEFGRRKGLKAAKGLMLGSRRRRRVRGGGRGPAHRGVRGPGARTRCADPVRRRVQTARGEGRLHRRSDRLCKRSRVADTSHSTVVRGLDL